MTTKIIHQFPLISSVRLSLRPLSEDDVSFVYQLLNSDGWKQFIGDRKINNLDDATQYIAKIHAYENVNYWTVVRNDTNEKTGIVTLINRTEYEWPDLGFAFLPDEIGKGYAYEASIALLEILKNIQYSPCLIAIIVHNNTKSINLLKRLGFQYEREQIEDNGETLHIYQLGIC